MKLGKPQQSIKGGASPHFVLDGPYPGIAALIINILYVFTTLLS